MMKLTTFATAVLVAGMSMVQPSYAGPINFLFSFSNNVAGCGNCNVPGTVKGEIFGLQDNSNGPASSVVILSHPAGILNLPATPFLVSDYAATLGLFISQNDFTVSNGAITFGIYQIFGGYFDLNVANAFNTLASPNAATRVQNLQGLAGVTFTQAPEPFTLSLFGAGLAGAVAMRRRKKA
jgi:hypothetical protein